jgi:hypothetical protein
MTTFQASSIASGAGRALEEAVSFIHGFLALEIARIRKQRQRELSKLENERSALAGLGMSQRVQENKNNQIHNTKTTELYKGLAKKEGVYSVLKNGDGPFFDPFAQQPDKHHPESDILARE